jgi:hypothetical protein
MDGNPIGDYLDLQIWSKYGPDTSNFPRSSTRYRYTLHPLRLLSILCVLPPTLEVVGGIVSPSLGFETTLPDQVAECHFLLQTHLVFWLRSICITGMKSRGTASTLFVCCQHCAHHRRPWRSWVASSPQVSDMRRRSQIWNPGCGMPLSLTNSPRFLASVDMHRGHEKQSCSLHSLRLLSTLCASPPTLEVVGDRCLPSLGT